MTAAPLHGIAKIQDHKGRETVIVGTPALGYIYRYGACADCGLALMRELPPYTDVWSARIRIPERPRCSRCWGVTR